MAEKRYRCAACKWKFKESELGQIGHCGCGGVHLKEVG
jgi:DNA-directed RNA polymerase subunit RPC12/RpoP